MTSYETAKAIANYLKCRTSCAPKVAIVICGSTLSSLADAVADKTIINYSEIEQFPQSTVEGYSGNLVFGRLCCKDVVIMQGRFHPYEGFDVEQVTLPIRVFKLLGVETLIVTNSAGGLNPAFNVGDIMIIKDHICLPGLTGKNALIGKNDDRFGPRFPAMTNIYTKELRELAKKTACELGITDFLREGVYVELIGPTYETPAEARFLRQIGADAAGMSTAHETAIAKHAGMKVFGLSLIVKKILTDENSSEQLTHEEVQTTCTKRAENIKCLLARLIQNIP
ncbi:hypothetical protein Aperf_G00000052480 [Anoplocephala perfoliata]